MFPIFDFNSQVVGFGGRIFENKSKDDSKGSAAEALAKAVGVKEAKYLNTTNTLLYDKSRILYGLDRAKLAIRKSNACVLVEGYTDVIMSAQAGVENVAASSGTALTAMQLKMIKRFTDNIVLGYDMDIAGDTANRRGIDLALAQGFNVSVARPPFEGKDPADVIAQSPEEWRKAVANTRTIMDFYFDRAFAADDKNTPQGRKKIVGFVLPVIKMIPNAVEQAYWLQKIADRLEVRDIHYEDYLRQELKKVKLNEYISEGVNNAVSAPALPREKRLEERLLALSIKYPKIAGLIEKPALDSFSASAKEIIEKIKTVENFNGEGLGNGAKDLYEAIFMEAESETIDEKAAVGEAEFHSGRIKGILFKNSLANLSRELLEAEKKGDAQTAARLRDQFNLLAKSSAQIPPKSEK
jgi:DNA primase